MISREFLKGEIDKIQDGYLEVLYRIVKALINPSTVAIMPQNVQVSDWHIFVEQTYGSLSDDPITRGDQGQFEIREIIE